MSRRSVRKRRHRRPVQNYAFASMTFGDFELDGVQSLDRLKRRVAERLLVSPGSRIRDDVYGCAEVSLRPLPREGWDR